MWKFLGQANITSDRCPQIWTSTRWVPAQGSPPKPVLHQRVQSAYAQRENGGWKGFISCVFIKWKLMNHLRKDVRTRSHEKPSWGQIDFHCHCFSTGCFHSIGDFHPTYVQGDFWNFPILEPQVTDFRFVNNFASSISGILITWGISWISSILSNKDTIAIAIE